MKRKILTIVILIILIHLSYVFSSSKDYSNKVLIKFKQEVIEKELSLNTIFGIREMKNLFPFLEIENVKPLIKGKKDFSAFYIVELSSNFDLINPAMVISGCPFVEYAEPDYIYALQRFPNDKLFSQQWYLHNTESAILAPDADIDAPEAWDITTGSPSAVIAVIDSGLELTHPEFIGKIWINEDETPQDGIDNDGNGYIDDVNGWNFIGNSSVITDEYGHGTAIGGLITANTDNTTGIAGVSWHSKIMPLKAAAGEFAYASDLVPAIIYAADNGASIISLAMTSLFHSKALEEAIEYAFSKGCLVISPAGNSYGDTPFYPAAYSLTVAVSATNRDDELANFSSYGAHIDLSAPGANIIHPFPPNQYTTSSGSSFASALVCGVASLILSLNPSLSPVELTSILKSAVDDKGSPGWDKKFGSGRINALKAVNPSFISPSSLISYPSFYQILWGTIDIKGTAEGTNFNSYVLEYGAGFEPTNWIRIKESFSPVKDGILGKFLLTGKPELVYTIRLIVYDNANHFSLDTVSFYNLEAMGLKEGWPVFTDASVQSSPAIIDFDDDGIQEVIIGTMDGKVLALRSDGSNLKGFPVDLSEPIFSSCAVGDIDDDGKLDIVVATLKGGIFAIKNSGMIMSGWPQYIDQPFFSSPALEDFDGDRDLEIVIGGFDNKVYVFHHTGLILPGWPQPTDGKVFSSPAVGDIDNDGKYEIVCASNGSKGIGSFGKLYMWNYDGVSMPGSPIFLPKITDLFEDIGTGGAISPALADLNMDGNLEIIAGAVLGPMFAYDYEGRIIAAMSALPACTNSSPAIGDVDGNGELDIVAGAIDYIITSNTIVHNLAVWSRKGGDPITGWPVAVNGLVMSSPILANIEGNFLPEIIAGSADRYLYGLKANGKNAMGFPIPLNDWIISSPAIGDIDGDGKCEVVIGCNRGGVFAFDLDAPYQPDLIPWGQFHHDPRRTGRYGDTFPPAPPKGVQLKLKPEGINISWTPNVEPDIAGYLVFYDSDGSGRPYNGIDAKEGFSPIDVGMKTSFTITGLTVGNLYYFAVSAYDTSGNFSRYSKEVFTRYTGELVAPKVLLGGYFDTRLDRHQGGIWKMLAYCIDPSGPGDIKSVELTYQGNSTGIFLKDDGIAPDIIAGDGVYSANLSIPGGLFPTLYYFGFAVKDRAQNSGFWPVLEVY